MTGKFCIFREVFRTLLTHDYVTKWKHFSALLAICAGNSPVTGESPLKGQWRWALILYLIYAWINGWVNNREAGDLRRHRTNYDVRVMFFLVRNAEAHGLEGVCQIVAIFGIIYLRLWVNISIAYVYINPSNSHVYISSSELYQTIITAITNTYKNWLAS